MPFPRSALMNARSTCRARCFFARGPGLYCRIESAEQGELLCLKVLVEIAKGLPKLGVLVFERLDLLLERFYMGSIDGPSVP